MGRSESPGGRLCGCQRPPGTAAGRLRRLNDFAPDPSRGLHCGRHLPRERRSRLRQPAGGGLPASASVEQGLLWSRGAVTPPRNAASRRGARHSMAPHPRPRALVLLRRSAEEAQAQLVAGPPLVARPPVERRPFRRAHRHGGNGHRPTAGGRPPRPARWHCPVCGRSFTRRDQSHSCRRVPIDAHFPPQSAARSLFDALLAAIENQVGPCGVVSLPCCIHLAATDDFLAVLPKLDRLEIPVHPAPPARQSEDQGMFADRQDLAHAQRRCLAGRARRRRAAGLAAGGLRAAGGVARSMEGG
jgi:hypothetical protein